MYTYALERPVINWEAKHQSLIDSHVIRQQKLIHLVLTKEYPLRGYTLGVLTHTTAMDQYWGGDENLKNLGFALLRSC